MDRAVVVLCLVTLTACKAHVFSPPSGTYLVESSQTLGAGNHGVRGEMFLGGALFGPKILSARGSYRHGVTEKVDVSAESAVITVLGSKPGDSNPNLITVRAGAKYARVKHFAILGGIGGGGSAAGGFLSPDLGVVAAFENPYLVPFAGARGLISVPIGARTVRFTIADDSSDAKDEDTLPDEFRGKPELTYGVQLSLGARIPLRHDPPSNIKPSLLCAVGVTSLFDSTDKRDYGGLSCAVDVTF